MSDDIKNLAYSSLTVAPSPAASGTSLTVQVGHGARFPTPPFNATVWATGQIPTLDNAEIVRVTGIAGDVFTITRAQEGTSARTIVVGDQIAATITAKILDDITTAMSNHLADAADAHDASAVSFTPVGTIAATDVQAAIAEVASEAGVTDHGALSGLADDDHSKYAKAASITTYADRKQRTSGNITLNSTTWTNVDTGLDIVLTAATGQWIEIGVSTQWGSEALNSYLDVCSVVSGSPVNMWGTDAAPDDNWRGVSGWTGLSGATEPIAGSVIRKLVAGDISAGTVTLRLRGRTASASNKTLSAGGSGSFPLIFWARNLG